MENFATVKQLREAYPSAEICFFRNGWDLTKQNDISLGCPLYYAKIKEYKIVRTDPTTVIFVEV